MPAATPHAEFAKIFARSREILLTYSQALVVVRDVPGNIYLDAPYQMKNGKPLFFAAATSSPAGSASRNDG